MSPPTKATQITRMKVIDAATVNQTRRAPGRWGREMEGRENEWVGREMEGREKEGSEMEGREMDGSEMEGKEMDGSVMDGRTTVGRVTVNSSARLWTEAPAETPIVTTGTETAASSASTKATARLAWPLLIPSYVRRS